MNTSADATLTAIALVERIVLTDTHGLQELVAVVPVEQWSQVAGCLATVLAATVEQQHGVTGAVERIAGWRTAALAGERDA